MLKLNVLAAIIVLSLTAIASAESWLINGNGHVEPPPDWDPLDVQEAGFGLAGLAGVLGGIWDWLSGATPAEAAMTGVRRTATSYAASQVVGAGANGAGGNGAMTTGALVNGVPIGQAGVPEPVGRKVSLYHLSPDVAWRCWQSGAFISCC